jgi:enoyl-CoA hydratase/carnithine racemase
MSTPKGADMSTLVVSQHGDILKIGINRGPKRNSLNDGAILALESVFSALPEEVRAVVIHGVGEHFSAGLDLSELTEQDATDGIRHSMMWHRVFEKIEFGRVPVVAALKGAVIGGGLELACACHIRVAEPGAFYALPEGQRGIFVGGGGSVRLPRLIGAHRMADMMLTGRTYGAAEGVALGFSQYLVGEGQSEEQAMEIAGKCAKTAPMTAFAVIHALPRTAEGDPKTGYMLEAMVSSIAQADKEAKARVRAFLEKRAAKVKAPQ